MTEVPIHGGTLTEGVVGYPRYINPILNITDSGRDLSSLIYSGLMKHGPTGELVPDLAASYTISPDGLTYDFIIKKNIYFQDGVAVTADDVEFTILKAKDDAIKSPKEANWLGVAVEKINSNEIRFTLKKPYGPFLENTTLGILPKHLWNDAADPDSFTLSDLNRRPIGSGPYMIQSVKTDSAGLPEYYHLVSFKRHVGGEPYIKDLIVRIYTNENDLINSYNKGEVQSLNNVSPQKVVFTNSSKSLVATSTLPRVFGVFFNQSENPVLIHKEVRQALNQAVDRQKIVDEVLAGYGVTIREPFPPGLLSATSSTQISNAADIEGAKKILTTAGWQIGENDLMQKITKSKNKNATETLSLTISTVNTPDLVNAANLIKEEWQSIGAAVELKIYEPTDFNQNVIRSRKYDALLFGEIIPPGLDVFGYWHSSERIDPGLNIALYTNSKADKFLEAARATSSREIAVSNYLKFEQEVNNDIPTVFLYSPDFIYIVPKELKGLNLSHVTLPADRFNDVEHWYLETEKVWKIFAK